MFLIRPFFFAVLCFSAVIVSTYAAEQKPPVTKSTTKADVWVPVDEADLAVFLDAPAYHFTLAKEFLQKGENSKAAAELKRGNTFLVFLKDRIAIASKQIEELSNNIAIGKDNDMANLSAVTAIAIKVVDHKYAMLPVEVQGTSVFDDAYRYHFDKAKAELEKKNNPVAAAELHKAIAFLKLNAAHAGNKAGEEFHTAVAELKTISEKLKKGTAVELKEMDAVFTKAVKALTPVKK